MKTFLTPDQVFALNEKHGWFEFGDAQSNVSQGFAQDAILMHERMREAAPAMFGALKALLEYCEGLDDFSDDPVADKLLREADVALSGAIHKP